MAKINNSLQVSGKKTIGQYLSGVKVKTLINNTLGNEREAQKFTASICSAVSVNPELQTCEPSSIVSAGLLANALNLSLSPTIGLCYIVPFEDRKNGRKTATFILGYKGYIQLAIRSGYYKKLNVLAIKEGELISYDPLSEDLKIELIEDDEVRENTPTIGYYAMFEYLSGFRKAIYWTKKKMELHALKYSKGYASDKRYGRKYTFWSKDFDAMAYKTMLRQLLSKWGIMSIELENAFSSDNDGMIMSENFDDIPDDKPNNTLKTLKENKQQLQGIETDNIPDDKPNNSPIENFFDQESIEQEA